MTTRIWVKIPKTKPPFNHKTLQVPMPGSHKKEAQEDLFLNLPKRIRKIFVHASLSENAKRERKAEKSREKKNLICCKRGREKGARNEIN
jgi:hypothetical protein